MLDDEVRRELISGKYAFLDAGCGSGGSIKHCQLRFELGRGLGVDWYGADLEVAREQGYAVAFADVMLEEFPEKCVRFASMMDVLEHLPDEAAAVGVMRNLSLAAKDFLFIRHPSFDDMEYLAERGLKLSWTDWTGHPNMMKIEDYRRVFASLGWTDYVIIPHMLFTDSSHVTVVPATAPTDTIEYDEALHGPKPHVEFDRPIFGKYDIFVRLNPEMDPEVWERVANVDGWESIWE